MPKVGVEQQRRRELIDATLAVISEYGYADTTVAKIARQAGMSVGIISHYFGGKSALLEASMCTLMQSLQYDVLAARRHVEDPKQRLQGMVQTLLSEQQGEASVIGAWLSFWSQVPFNSRFYRLQSIYRRRVQSNICFDLAQYDPTLSRQQVQLKSESLASMIDGLWLRSVLAGEIVDQAPVLAYLDVLMMTDH